MNNVFSSFSYSQSYYGCSLYLNKFFEPSKESSENIIEISNEVMDLPDEVWTKILSYLNPQDIVSFSHAKRQFYKISNDTLLWKSICRQYGFEQEGYSDQFSQAHKKMACVYFFSAVHFQEISNKYSKEKETLVKNKKEKTKAYSLFSEQTRRFIGSKDPLQAITDNTSQHLKAIVQKMIEDSLQAGGISLVNYLIGSMSSIYSLQKKLHKEYLECMDEEIRKEIVKINNSSFGDLKQTHQVLYGLKICSQLSQLFEWFTTNEYEDRESDIDLMLDDVVIVFNKLQKWVLNEDNISLYGIGTPVNIVLGLFGSGLRKSVFNNQQIKPPIQSPDLKSFSLYIMEKLLKKDNEAFVIPLHDQIKTCIRSCFFSKKYDEVGLLLKCSPENSHQDVLYEILQHLASEGEEELINKLIELNEGKIPVNDLKQKRDIFFRVFRGGNMTLFGQICKLLNPPPEWIKAALQQ